jgi:hypothetical protein
MSSLYAVLAIVDRLAGRVAIKGGTTALTPCRFWYVAIYALVA